MDGYKVCRCKNVTIIERLHDAYFVSSKGIKVIGGVKELTGEEYGVYVKRILPGGIASNDGKFSLIIFCQNLSF